MAGQPRSPESSGGGRRDDAPPVATSAGSSEGLSTFISPQREFADPVMWPRTPLGPRADWQCRKKVVLSV
jgi:hypothetical protein